MFYAKEQIFASLNEPAQIGEENEPESGEQTLDPSPGANIHSCNQPEEQQHKMYVKNLLLQLFRH